MSDDKKKYTPFGKPITLGSRKRVWVNGQWVLVEHDHTETQLPDGYKPAFGRPGDHRRHEISE